MKYCSGGKNIDVYNDVKINVYKWKIKLLQIHINTNTLTERNNINYSRKKYLSCSCKNAIKNVKKMSHSHYMFEVVKMEWLLVVGLKLIVNYL